MILAITQARMASSRLPGKVLLEINSKSLLKIHVERVRKAKLIQKHIVAISNNPSDNVLEEYCISQGIEYYRGSENDVLDRFYTLSKICKAQIIVRLTADCPLIDPAVIDEILKIYLSNNVDYVSNTLKPSFPDGIDVEVFSFQALEKAWKESKLVSDREHVTPYIWKNSSFKGGKIFSSLNFQYVEDYSGYRLTVDEKEDFLLIEKIIHHLTDNKTWLEYINYIQENKIYINSKFSRNEGYTRSLSQDS